MGEDDETFEFECRWCEGECKCFEVSECNICMGENGDHDINCPENDSPFAMLLRDGFD